jgi:hypothetical protein
MKATITRVRDIDLTLKIMMNEELEEKKGLKRG